MRDVSELGEVRTRIAAGKARRSHRSCIVTSKRAAVWDPWEIPPGRVGQQD